MNELLARRELLGLRFALIFNLAMMLFFVGVTVSSAQSTFEFLTTLSFVAVGVVMIGFFLVMNYRGRFISASGWVTVITYLVIDLALPWVWYQSVGGLSVPRSYFLKIGIVPLSSLFLVLCCLPGRPAYPLVFTIGASLGLVGHIVAALTDPRTVFAGSILDSTVGPGANMTQTATTDLMFTLSGALLVVFISRFRKTVIEASRAEHSTAQLGRYFSPGLVPLIARSDASFLKPGGRLQTVTVLFSDIRGFTTLSEGLEPARVVELLSLYQEQMVAAIFEHGGTLDKFIGDGIMATFGTPSPAPDDAQRAVRAAVSMQSRLTSLNVTLASRGFPILRQGIGVHSGPVIAGNVGTKDRLEYTVIGDTVNTASRLESLCKETGDTLLISQRVAESLTDALALIPRGQLPLKGKTETLEVFGVAPGTTATQ